FVFFFSSRRRHTRSKRDWSSDVCSSDLSTTGVGEAIAIPHAKSAAVARPSIAFGRSAEGIDFDSMDGKPVHLFFMIAASEGANNEHLEALSRLSTFLMDPKFQEKMYHVESIEDILQAVNEKEAELDAPEEETVE